ncbi:MAG: hypothetical protein JSS86_19470 [Cyanobacteria bacterium SZAS LIN-2]|nr:hypothetical protein [Cyanobacteria bacterium SZAS LIN-3]MBS1998518.1 hypothetical protein [Cyanobacteria bacterium SZAS LIN-2]MBS2009507.1 hypothetical protein [Cyanobacteria bacterium SZAS TMP-1]
MNSKATFIKRSVLASALVLSQSVLLSPLAAVAAGEIRIAGATIFSVPAAGKTSADKRAESVQQNLDNALVAAKDRSPSAVNITYVKGVPVVTVGGYQVVTVDSGTAKALHTTPALLAKKWGDSIRGSLRDQASITSYVGQLSGDYAANAPAPVNTAPPQQQAYQPPQQQAPQPQMTYQQPVNYTTQPNYPPQGYQQPQGQQYAQPPGGYRQGRVAYAPAGMTMNVTLSSGISTTVAKAGDLITASLSQPLVLGDSTIPAGSVLEGTVTDAENGRMLGRSGSLGIKFNRMRTPDGIETPISAHLVGGIGKYSNNGNDVMKGETWKTKVGQGAIRTGIGAGAGAALGTAVGAIAAGGHGAGTGAWSGTAIGAGVGLADSVLLRKGKDVNIPAGTPMQLQLDQAATFAGGGAPATAGQGPYGY